MAFESQLGGVGSRDFVAWLLNRECSVLWLGDVNMD